MEKAAIAQVQVPPYNYNLTGSKNSLGGQQPQYLIAHERPVPLFAKLRASIIGHPQG